MRLFASIFLVSILLWEGGINIARAELKREKPPQLTQAVTPTESDTCVIKDETYSCKIQTLFWDFGHESTTSLLELFEKACARLNCSMKYVVGAGTLRNYDEYTPDDFSAVEMGWDDMVFFRIPVTDENRNEFRYLKLKESAHKQSDLGIVFLNFYLTNPYERSYHTLQKGTKKKRFRTYSVQDIAIDLGYQLTTDPKTKIHWLVVDGYGDQTGKENKKERVRKRRYGIPTYYYWANDPAESIYTSLLSGSSFNWRLLSNSENYEYTFFKNITGSLRHQEHMFFGNRNLRRGDYLGDFDNYLKEINSRANERLWNFALGENFSRQDQASQ